MPTRLRLNRAVVVEQRLGKFGIHPLPMVWILIATCGQNAELAKVDVLMLRIPLRGHFFLRSLVCRAIVYSRPGGRFGRGAWLGTGEPCLVHVTNARRNYSKLDLPGASSRAIRGARSHVVEFPLFFCIFLQHCRHPLISQGRLLRIWLGSYFSYSPGRHRSNLTS